jgi:hypothetical protein
MPTTTFDPTDDTPNANQVAAEAAALKQGEALQQARDEDRARQYEQLNQENDDVGLIAGKFKSQEDLLKAYKELESKLGRGESSEEEEPSEEQPESTEEAPPEEGEELPSETVRYMTELGQQYDQTGDLSEEAIERLSGLDPKELIASYLQYTKANQSKQQAASMQTDQINDIKQSIGGEEAYNDMIQWASTSLPEADIDSFNQVTQTNNPAAIRFAVEALNNRFRNQEGYEAPLVTGRSASAPSVKPYRSQAELSRDIANPMYKTDPAFRQDVEERLSLSTNLL